VRNPSGLLYLAGDPDEEGEPIPGSPDGNAHPHATRVRTEYVRFGCQTKKTLIAESSQSVHADMHACLSLHTGVHEFQALMPLYSAEIFGLSLFQHAQTACACYISRGEFTTE
jgi:hypothetical protein